MNCFPKFGRDSISKTKTTNQDWVIVNRSKRNTYFRSKPLDYEFSFTVLFLHTISNLAKKQCFLPTELFRPLNKHPVNHLTIPIKKKLAKQAAHSLWTRILGQMADLGTHNMTASVILNRQPLHDILNQLFLDDG